MSTFLDFAIGLSLVNGISGEVNRIITDFENMEGVTDAMMSQLTEFKNISITGGLLAGAGVAGLMLTKEVLTDCIKEAEKLQSVSTTLEIKAFGSDLLSTNINKIQAMNAEMEGLKDTAMNISLDTVFNAQQIEESMISMIKGGMSKEMVGASGAESNAYFAQINDVDAGATADATVKFTAGFQLKEDEIKDSLDLITRYSDASIANALALQQNIGNASGTAMGVWKGRGSMEIAEETIQLVAATKYTAGNEAAAATMVRNFLDAAGNKMFTEPQAELMQNAGWLNDGKSIFIDYNTGMLKNAAEIERIIEEASNKLDAVDFNSLIDVVFGDRGKKTAQALAQQGGTTDLSTLKVNAGKQLGIDEQVARQMETAAAQSGIFNESVNTLKATLGTPFLDSVAAGFGFLNEQLKVVNAYFKEHPEVTKYIVAVAAGASIFLIVVGTIMSLIGLMGALKLIWSVTGAKMITAIMPVITTMASVMAVVLIIAGLAYVVYRNWSALKPQFESIMGRISEILTIGRESFQKFADKAAPVLKGIWDTFESGALFIIGVVCPIIEGGLGLIINLLTGDFASAWDSLNPVARILLLILAPSIVAVTGCLIMMGAAMLGDKLIALGTAFALNAASIAATIWKGIVAAATFVQTAWNIVMNGGTAATILQKVAVAALYPFMLLVKGATSIWTGVQWLLNAALSANPIGIVIILIIGIIAVVGIATGYFKKFAEWVAKGWDKLKGFLGFKRDAKDELEAPVDIGINETVDKQVNVLTTGVSEADIKNIQMYSNIPGSKMNIEADININNESKAEYDNIMKQISAGYDMPVELDFSSMSEGDLADIMKGYENMPVGFDLSQMKGQTDEATKALGSIGTDGAAQLANGLGSEEALRAVGVSVDSINGTITEGLVNNDEMKIYGSNLMQSFISGMNSKMDSLRMTASVAATVIGDYLAVHSPTKQGALHTNQLWGGNLMKSFISGMYGKNAQLEGAVALVSNTISGINNGGTGFDINYKGLALGKRQSNNDADGTNNIGSPIYIMIQSNGKNEKEIGVAVAKELEKRGFGKKKVGIDSSLTMSPYGYSKGY